MTTIITDTLAAFGALFVVLCIAFMYLVRRGKKARKRGKGRPDAHPGNTGLPRHADTPPTVPATELNSNG